jgi:hypothetical protein
MAMTTLEYSPKDPAPGPAPVRFLFRHNPFYLLSAMCMLAGCLSLTNSLSWTSIGLGRLLALIVTLNVYEALLLGLGLYLLGRRGVVRDGLMLLFLEAMFLVDAAFLNVEVYAIDLHVGVAANAVVFLLAAAKLCLVFRGLRLPLDRTFGLVLTQLAVLFVTPGVFAYVSHHHDGALPPGVTYAAWWVVGLVPMLATLLLRGRRLNELTGEPAPVRDWVAAVIRRSYLCLPFVSLLVHLGMLHWVYDARLHAAYAAPVLLGIAVLLGGAVPSWLFRPGTVAFLRLVLPAMAVLLSLDAPAVLRAAPLGAGSRVVVTPAVVALGAAYVVYVCIYLSRYAFRMIAAAVAVVLAFAFGPSPAQVGASGRQWTEWAVGVGARIFPRTTTGWGVIAVGAAFAFLGIGAAVSLRKPPELKDEG